LKDIFLVHSGQASDEKRILNSAVVCVPVSSRTPGTNSPEDYDSARIRRNPYEEAMFRIEEERFEVDMAIERNALAMRQVEPIAEEVAMLRETEEKDGQPIGRLQYKLKSKTLNSIQINAIGRIYGDMGDEVIEHLARNPLGTIPIIYQRLRQKDQEWRKQKSELLAKWRAITEANYEGTRDVMCYKLKRDIEKALSDERLLEECKKARSFCSSLEKRSSSSINFGLSSPDRSAVLYEPYGVVELKMESAAHEFAVKLLTRQLDETYGEGTPDRQAIHHLLSEFLMPFFEYPATWLKGSSCDCTTAPQCKSMHPRRACPPWAILTLCCILHLTRCGWSACSNVVG
jgi:Sin3 family co-repressor